MQSTRRRERPRPSVDRNHRHSPPDGAKRGIPRLRAGDPCRHRRVCRARRRCPGALAGASRERRRLVPDALGGDRRALGHVDRRRDGRTLPPRAHRPRRGNDRHGGRAVPPRRGGRHAGHRGSLLFAPDNLWMLPGLWQILFSLGVFASCRFFRVPSSRPASGTSRPGSHASRSRAARERFRPGPWGSPTPWASCSARLSSSRIPPRRKMAKLGRTIGRPAASRTRGSTA